MTRVAVATKL